MIIRNNSGTVTRGLLVDETGVRHRGAGVRLESFPATTKPHARTHPIAARAPALSRSRQLTVYSISLGVWFSGVIWLLAHYFMEQEGAFGPTPHPLEFWSIAAHGAFALATLWMLGLLWAIHIPAGWRESSPPLVGKPDVRHCRPSDPHRIPPLLFWRRGPASCYCGAALGVGLACPLLFVVHRFARDPAH
jgi:hypothetical protein